MKKIFLLIIISLFLTSCLVLAQQTSSQRSFSDFLLQTSFQAGTARLEGLVTQGIGQSEEGKLILDLYRSRGNLQAFTANLVKSKACESGDASEICNALGTVQSMITTNVSATHFINLACSFQEAGEICSTVNNAKAEFEKYRAMGQNPMGSLQGYMMAKLTEQISPEIGKGLQYYHQGKTILNTLKAGPGALGRSIMQQQITQRIAGQQPSSPLSFITGRSITNVALNLDAEGIKTDNCLVGLSINGNFGDISNCRTYSSNTDVSTLILGLTKDIPEYRLILGQACNIYRKNTITAIYPDLENDPSRQTLCTLNFQDLRGNNNLKTIYSGYSGTEQKIEIDFEQLDIPETHKRQLSMMMEDLDITLRSGTYVFDTNNKLIYAYLKPVEDKIYEFYDDVRVKVPANSYLVYISGKIFIDTSLVEAPKIVVYQKIQNEWQSSTVHSTALPVKISYLADNYVELKGDKFVITSDQTDNTIVVANGAINFKSFDDFIVTGTETLVTDKDNMFGIRTINQGSNVQVRSCNYPGSTELEHLTSTSNLVTYCTKDDDFFLKGVGKDYELNIDGKIRYTLNSGNLVYHTLENKSHVEAYGDITLSNSNLPLRFRDNKIIGLTQTNVPLYDISFNSFKLNNFYGFAGHGTLCTGTREMSSIYCDTGNLLLTLNEENSPKETITENIIMFNCASSPLGDYCSVWFDGVKLNSNNVHKKENIIVLDIKNVYYALSLSGHVGYIDNNRFVPYQNYINKENQLIDNHLIIPRNIIDYLNSIASVKEFKMTNYNLDKCPATEEYLVQTPENCYMVNGMCLVKNKLMLKDGNCWRAGYFET